TPDVLNTCTSGIINFWVVQFGMGTAWTRTHLGRVGSQPANALCTQVALSVRLPPVVVPPVVVVVVVVLVVVLVVAPVDAPVVVVVVVLVIVEPVPVVPAPVVVVVVVVAEAPVVLPPVVVVAAGGELPRATQPINEYLIASAVGSQYCT